MIRVPTLSFLHYLRAILPMNARRGSLAPAALGALALGLAAAIALVGCGATGPPKVIVAADAEQPTAESRLDAIMERLTFALSSAHTPSDSGVVSHRRATHLLLPGKAGEAPRAEVTVTHDVALVTGADAIVKEAQKTTTPPAIKDEENYTLVYEKDRWKLLEEPKSGTVAVCWEYALQDQ